MNLKLIFASLAAVVFTLACSHTLVPVTPGAAHVEQAGVLSISTGFLKDKAKKFDVQMVVHNLSGHSLIVWLKDIQCARGQIKGDITMTNARHGDMPIVWKADESKTIVFTCDYKIEARGTFSVVFTKIMDNPSDDGRTSVKTLAKDLKFEQADNGPVMH